MTNFPMQYRHPHDATHIVDRTGITEEILNNRGTILFMPGVTDRGPDGTMLEFTGGDMRTLIRTLGQPNFKRHGQAIYNAVNWVRSGGSLTFMRVTARDATYSNVIIVAKVKESKEQKRNSNGQLLYINDLTDEETTDATRTEQRLITPGTPAIPGTPNIYAVDIDGNPSLDPDGQPIILTPGTPEIPAVAPVYEPVTVNFVHANECKYDIKLESKCLKNLRVKEQADVMLFFNQLYNGTQSPADVAAVEEDDGYVTYPLFIVLMNGKGKYGDNFTFRMAPDLVADRDTRYRNYQFNLLENTSHGFVLAEDVYNVSMYADARNMHGGNEYIEDVIGNHSQNIHLYVNESIISELTEKMSKGLGVDPESVDFLFGNTHASAQRYSNVTINVDSINLSAVQGITLKHGNDGAFARGYSTAQDAIDDRYLDAYLGDITDAIFNKVKHPISIMMDANFNIETKIALRDCAIKRDDCSFILDMGDQTTLRNCLEIRQNILSSFDTWRGRIESQTAVVYDNYTRKDIRVTATYIMSEILPVRFALHGNHRPIAGLNRGTVTGIVKNSIRPMINNKEDKELFYNNQINYIEEFTSGLFYFATQLTTQQSTSQLSDYNNTLVLFDIKRDLEFMVNYWRYEFTDSEDIARFISQGTEVLSRHEHKCKDISLDIGQTQFQRERKILQTYVVIRFKDIIERHLIEIEISR